MGLGGLLSDGFSSGDWSSAWSNYVNSNNLASNAYMANQMADSLGYNSATSASGTSDEASINNELYQQAAIAQMIYQTHSAERAMQFSSEEAEKQRDWSSMMSNTAYQRSVRDLKAAGLNPILAYTNGPASTPTGSSATGFAQSGSQANVDVTDWASNKRNATANLLSSIAQTVYASAKTVESVGKLVTTKKYSFGFGR